MCKEFSVEPFDWLERISLWYSINWSLVAALICYHAARKHIVHRSERHKFAVFCI